MSKTRLSLYILSTLLAYLPSKVCGQCGAKKDVPYLPAFNGKARRCPRSEAEFREALRELSEEIKKARTFGKQAEEVELLEKLLELTPTHMPVLFDLSKRVLLDMEIAESMRGSKKNLAGQQAIERMELALGVDVDCHLKGLSRFIHEETLRYAESRERLYAEWYVNASNPASPDFLVEYEGYELPYYHPNEAIPSNLPTIQQRFDAVIVSQFAKCKAYPEPEPCDMNTNPACFESIVQLALFLKLRQDKLRTVFWMRYMYLYNMEKWELVQTKYRPELACFGMSSLLMLDNVAPAWGAQETFILRQYEENLDYLLSDQVPITIEKENQPWNGSSEFERAKVVENAKTTKMSARAERNSAKYGGSGDALDNYGDDDDLGDEDSESQAEKYLLSNGICFPIILPLAYAKTERRRILSVKTVQVMMKFQPGLLYHSPHIFTHVFPEGVPHLPGTILQALPQFGGPLLRRKLKLGVVLTMGTDNSSISACFVSTLRRLPSYLFDITFVHYPGGSDPTETVRDFNEFNDIDIPRENDNEPRTFNPHIGNIAPSLPEVRKKIAERYFDILLFMDHSMKREENNMLLLSKLAPVQALTFGHPATSGVPRDILDYFISWEGNERFWSGREEFVKSEGKRGPNNSGVKDVRVDDAKDDSSSGWSVTGGSSKNAKKTSSTKALSQDNPGPIDYQRLADSTKRVQSRYSEKIVLIPQEFTYGYFEERSDHKKGRSLLQSRTFGGADVKTGGRDMGEIGNWFDFTRHDFLERVIYPQLPPSDIKKMKKLAKERTESGEVADLNWYFAPHMYIKMHSDLDVAFRAIQKRDPRGLIFVPDMISSTENDSFSKGQVHNYAAILRRRMSRKEDHHRGVVVGDDSKSETNFKDETAASDATPTGKRQGVLSKQFVWLPKLAAPLLMAMHNISDVFLDGIYFGGDLTCREAMEVGRPIISLPNRYNFGFTFGYYKLMDGEYTPNLLEKHIQALAKNDWVESKKYSNGSSLRAASPSDLKLYDHLVAHNISHFADLAVEVASNKGLQHALRSKIRKRAWEVIFRQKRAVREWARILWSMVGVKLDQNLLEGLEINDERNW